MIENTVFHYCSINTMEKILMGKSIRLSEITKSNDYKEMRWLREEIMPEVIKEEFKKRPFEISFKRMRETSSCQGVEAVAKLIDFCTEVKEASQNEGTVKLFKTITLASCFSEKEDMLSQWRGYADDGCGVSIGVDRSCLEAFQQTDLRSPLNFKSVIYDSTEQKKLIKNTVSEFLAGIEKASNENEYIELVHSLLSDVCGYSPLCKNPGFSEEMEIRLFLNFFNPIEISHKGFDEMNTRLPKGLFSEIGCQVHDKQFTYYTDLKFDFFQTPFISHVILGPKCKLDIEDARRALAFYRVKNAENIIIRRAFSTYR